MKKIKSTLEIEGVELETKKIRKFEFGNKTYQHVKLLILTQNIQF